MTPLPNQNHRVAIRLRTRDIWNVESRLIEINQLRAWLDELVEWQPDMYTLRFHSSGQRLNAWFVDEKHAAACALRWA